MRLGTYLTNMISDERFLTALTIMGIIMSAIDGIHHLIIHANLIQG